MAILGEIIDNDVNGVPITMALVNGQLRELHTIVDIKNDEIKYLPITNSFAHKAYLRTLQFILIKAVYDLYDNNIKVNIKHQLNHGIYGDFNCIVSEREIVAIKNKMNEIIKNDIRIFKNKFSKEEAIKILNKFQMNDKVELINSLDLKHVILYNLGDMYNYFYGNVGYRTGCIKDYDLIYTNGGFILRYPAEKLPNGLGDFIEQPKLENIFNENKKWLNIMDLPNVGKLNSNILNNNFIDTIRTNEALHDKKIAEIATDIYNRKNVRMVLIAGPSSSGKTTFCNKLSYSLKCNGVKTFPISLDDFFVERNETPIDEFGKLDYECVEALDLKLLNETFEKILNGEEVQLPTFDFKNGTKTYDSSKKIKLPENGILLIEGIHGLNDKLTSHIHRDNKYKIYLSPLTGLNIDRHNRVSPTDVRKCRRIVRDILSRGCPAERTLKMWDSIRRGEQRYIYKFVEESDVTFNTSLVYEINILKKHVIKELQKIEIDNEVYNEAQRLIEFLKLFVDIDDKCVPEDSLIREFIGGSCFYNY